MFSARPSQSSLARTLGIALALSAASARAHAQAAPAVLAPRDYLGFEVGADRQLADWPQITGYFARLAAASPSVRVDTLGRTTT